MLAAGKGGRQGGGLLRLVRRVSAALEFGRRPWRCHRFGIECEHAFALGVIRGRSTRRGQGTHAAASGYRRRGGAPPGRRVPRQRRWQGPGGAVPAWPAPGRRADRKRVLTVACSSRWAGAITRTSNDQWTLSYRNLLEDRASLRRQGERGSRRLPARQGAPPSRGRQPHEGQWRQQWAAERLFLCADGEADKAHGNETIRWHPEQSWLELKLPAPLARSATTSP